MTSVVHACREDDTAYHCAKVMKRENIGFVPVIDPRGKLVGVVTDRDLAMRVIAEGRPSTTELGRVMSKDIVTCAPDDELREAELRMSERRVSRVVVVAPFERILGILSLTDVVRVEERGRAGDVIRSVTSRESIPPPSLR